jgi:N-acyl-D-aspartate/D-glutamate deacylase
MMLPFAQKMAALSDPAFVEKLLAETPLPGDEIAIMLTRAFPRFFPLGAADAVPDYEPDAQHSVAAVAQRDGKTPWRVLYETMMGDGGRGMVYFPVFNYAYGHFDHLRELLASPHTIPSLGDGGAHCGLICDASMPTYLVSHWARGRTRGPRLPLEFVVKRQAADTAQLYGLTDRGQLAAGLLADINIFDPAQLALRMPHAVRDLPAQGRRLLQEASGYAYTIKRGAVTFESGAVSSARPGRLLRAGPAKAG